MENILTACGKDFYALKVLVENKNSELALYGCGVNGEVICRFLSNHGREVSFFVDQQAQERDFEVLGKKVISPRAFFEGYQDTSIIVTPDNQDSIISFLNENGVNEEHILSPFKRIEKQITILDEQYSPSVYCNVAKIKSFENDNINPDVTVFTILYNTPSWMLCRAIESVLTQSYGNFKYLIIDNGSTDSSEEIIRQYADTDRRIQYLRLKKNVPWSDEELLRILKENMNTEYVAMLDSDDYYEMDFLRKTIETADKDSSDIVQVNTFTYGHEGFKYNYYTQHIGRDICAQGDEKINLFLLRMLNVPVWGKLYRVKIFIELIDCMISYQSDIERDRNFCLDISWTTFLVLSSRKVSICDDVLHVRTWRTGSSEQADDHVSKWLSSIMWSINYLRKTGITDRELEVFDDAALMWLFSLSRNRNDVAIFRDSDIRDAIVEKFMMRPVCDKYRHSM